MVNEWREIARKRYENSYTLIWDRIFSKFSPQMDDTLWLHGAANYIFSTNNVKWAMDLRFPFPKIRKQLEHRLRNDIEKLSFIILTHEHEDHYDLETIRLVSDADVQWIIPHFFEKQPLYEAGLNNNKITWLSPGDCMEIEGINIKAFKSLHYMNAKKPGVPEMGYLIDTGEKRMLFPCDIREHAPEKLPHFDPVDILFAHVWLGAANALNYPYDHYLDSYCRFMNAIGAKKILLAHLYDVGRSLEEMWTYSHAGLVMDGLLSLNPEVEIAIPQLGMPYTL